MSYLWIISSLLLSIVIPNVHSLPIYNVNGIISSVSSPELNNVVVLCVAAAFFVCIALVALGCVCCRNNGLKVLHNENGLALPRHGGSNQPQGESMSEFTMFPPPSAVLAHPKPHLQEDEVTFEPLPEIRPRNISVPTPSVHPPRPAHFGSAVGAKGLSLHDWFDDTSLNFPRNQLQYLQEMGSGWFGQVVEGEAQGIVPGQRKTQVVVKILREDASPSEHIHFLHEVRPFRDLQHPNILRLLGRCLENDPFLIILEYLSADLKTFLIQHRSKSEVLLQDGLLLRMACNVATAVQFMHERGFVHTDLAARNCLVSSDMVVKVGDYGTSIQKFKEDYYCLGDIALPVRWCAPESLHCTSTTIETKEVTREANIWSLGVLLWELLEFGKLPYMELGDDDVLQRVVIERNLKLEQPKTPCVHKDRLYDIMQLCWGSASERPLVQRISALLGHLYDHRDVPSDSAAFESRWNSLQPVERGLLTPSLAGSNASSSVQLRFESDFSGAARGTTYYYSSSGGVRKDRDSMQSSSEFDPSLTGGEVSPSRGSLCTNFEVSLASHISPSLQNLRGSVEDLIEQEEKEEEERQRKMALFGPLEFKDDDEDGQKKISEAIANLDDVLAGDEKDDAEVHSVDGENDAGSDLFSEKSMPKDAQEGENTWLGDGTPSMTEPLSGDFLLDKPRNIADFLKLTVIESEMSSDSDVSQPHSLQGAFTRPEQKLVSNEEAATAERVPAKDVAVAASDSDVLFRKVEDQEEERVNGTTGEPSHMNNSRMMMMIGDGVRRPKEGDDDNAAACGGSSPVVLSPVSLSSSASNNPNGMCCGGVAAANSSVVHGSVVHACQCLNGNGGGGGHPCGVCDRAGTNHSILFGNDNDLSSGGAIENDTNSTPALVIPQIVISDDNAAGKLSNECVSPQEESSSTAEQEEDSEGCAAAAARFRFVFRGGDEDEEEDRSVIVCSTKDKAGLATSTPVGKRPPSVLNKDDSDDVDFFSELVMTPRNTESKSFSKDEVTFSDIETMPSLSPRDEKDVPRHSAGSAYLCSEGREPCSLTVTSDEFDSLPSMEYTMTGISLELGIERKDLPTSPPVILSPPDFEFKSSPTPEPTSSEASNSLTPTKGSSDVSSVAQTPPPPAATVVEEDKMPLVSLDDADGGTKNGPSLVEGQQNGFGDVLDDIFGGQHKPDDLSSLLKMTTGRNGFNHHIHGYELLEDVYTNLCNKTSGKVNPNFSNSDYVKSIKHNKDQDYCNRDTKTPLSPFDDEGLILVDDLESEDREHVLIDYQGAMNGMCPRFYLSPISEHDDSAKYSLITASDNDKRSSLVFDDLEARDASHHQPPPDELDDEVLIVDTETNEAILIDSKQRSQHYMCEYLSPKNAAPGNRFASLPSSYSGTVENDIVVTELDNDTPNTEFQSPASAVSASSLPNMELIVDDESLPDEAGDDDEVAAAIQDASLPKDGYDFIPSELSQSPVLSPNLYFEIEHTVTPEDSPSKPDSPRQCPFSPDAASSPTLLPPKGVKCDFHDELILESDEVLAGGEAEFGDDDDEGDFVSNDDKVMDEIYDNIERKLSCTSFESAEAGRPDALAEPGSPFSSQKGSPGRDTYTPDFESDVDDTSSTGTSCSSTSGSFECLHGKPSDDAVLQQEQQASAKEEGEEAERALDDGDDDDAAYITLHSWDSSAQPNRSSLLSPERKQESKMKKSVSFHEEDPPKVYNYPKEYDSEEEYGMTCYYDFEDEDEAEEDVGRHHMEYNWYSDFNDWDFQSAYDDDEIPEDIIVIDDDTSDESSPPPAPLQSHSLRGAGVRGGGASPSSIYSITSSLFDEDMDSLDSNVSLPNLHDISSAANSLSDAPGWKEIQLEEPTETRNDSASLKERGENLVELEDHTLADYEISLSFDDGWSKPPSGQKISDEALEREINSFPPSPDLSSSQCWGNDAINGFLDSDTFSPSHASADRNKDLISPELFIDGMPDGGGFNFAMGDLESEDDVSSLSGGNVSSPCGSEAHLPLDANRLPVPAIVIEDVSAVDSEGLGCGKQDGGDVGTEKSCEVLCDKDDLISDFDPLKKKHKKNGISIDLDILLPSLTENAKNNLKMQQAAQLIACNENCILSFGDSNEVMMDNNTNTRVPLNMNNNNLLLQSKYAMVVNDDEVASNDALLLCKDAATNFATDDNANKPVTIGSDCP